MISITQETVNHCTSIEVSENKRDVAIFHRFVDREGINKIAEFKIEEVWDMIRDAVATVDVSYIKEPGLFRRKGEAAAAILHTNKLFMRTT